MIKSKAILRKSLRQLFSEDSDLILLKDHYESFMPHKWQCPYCHQTGQFSKASSYSRTLITVEQGLRTEYCIDVPLLCCDCGHCHAIIPDFLLPYGSYSIRFILYVLKEYKRPSCSVSLNGRIIRKYNVVYTADNSSLNTPELLPAKTIIQY